MSNERPITIARREIKGNRKLPTEQHSRHITKSAVQKTPLRLDRRGGSPAVLPIPSPRLGEGDVTVKTDGVEGRLWGIQQTK